MQNFLEVLAQSTRTLLVFSIHPYLEDFFFCDIRRWHLPWSRFEYELDPNEGAIRDHGSESEIVVKVSDSLLLRS